MSKAKDKARAQSGQPHISGNGDLPEGKQRIKCQYPPCNIQIIIDIPIPGVPYKGLPPFCQLHLEMLNFHVWCMTAIRLEQQKTPSGIVLPGNAQYEAKLKEQPFIKS